MKTIMKILKVQSKVHEASMSSVLSPHKHIASLGLGRYGSLSSSWQDEGQYRYLLEDVHPYLYKPIQVVHLCGLKTLLGLTVNVADKNCRLWQLDKMSLGLYSIYLKH